MYYKRSPVVCVSILLFLTPNYYFTAYSFNILLTWPYSVSIYKFYKSALFAIIIYS